VAAALLWGTLKDDIGAALRDIGTTVIPGA
jgi:hypothetical protein